MTSGTGRCLQRKKCLHAPSPRKEERGLRLPRTGAPGTALVAVETPITHTKKKAAVYATAAVVSSFLTLSLSAPATLTGALGLLPFPVLQLCNVPIEDRLLLGREN